ncbi:patched domain-containing protein 3-like [Mytilus edulis]|uniref:patched domain-containing protein 3-like n=1 Tax=Mytilus edulis TaxID=6550 RepID=UPI0039F14D9C
MRTYVESTSVQDTDGITYRYSDVCARTFSACDVEGNIFNTTQFINDMNRGNITFPNYTLPSGQIIFLDRIIGGVSFAGRFIVSASALKFRFNLQSENFDISRKWEEAFIDRMHLFSNNAIRVEYSFSDSLSVELSKNVSGDIGFFSVTFTLMIIFSCLALMGSNCVDNRYYLGLAGILSTGLAILGSFGFVSLCGAKFVDIVGAMPFLILGIGVDDMFILLSGLADTNSEDDVETRIAQTMRTSGIAITITSITDIIAFCAGAASVFPSVRNFSWFTGCAILFCYLNYVTFYIGVMTINEKRVSKNLHWATCCKTRKKEEMEADGRSKAVIICCAGSPRKSRDEIEGPIEKYPKRLFKRIVLYTPSKIAVLLLFCGYLGVSVWGTTNFREDLDLRDLVSKDSYYYSSYDANQKLFSQSLFVSVNIRTTVDYRLASTFSELNSVLQKIRNDPDIQNDFRLSWFHSYISDASFDNTSDINFITGLTSFLSSPQGNLYINDVTISGSSVVSSRFHVLSASLTTSSSQAAMMVRLRDIAEASSLPVFVFSPAFIFFEQYVQIVPQTFQTLGISVSVVFLVTAIFMPLPTLIILVTISVTMIMVGVLAFMYFWDLTLSSVTMIHIIMCVGFSIDFSTHICHAFIQAEGSTRNSRVSVAIDRSGGPILNGALSSIIGILMLAFSKSFIFFSFFKVMFIVMIFGALHAILLLPVVLSLIGPNYEQQTNKADDKEINLSSYVKGSIPRISTASIQKDMHQTQN